MAQRRVSMRKTKEILRLKFEGDLTVQIDLTGINSATEVTLPGACDHPVSA